MKNKEEKSVLYILISVLLTAIAGIFLPKLTEKSAARSYKESKKRYINK